ncbi:MAG: hypothetical protein PVS3B2_00190 [Candidatus Dormibacteraceae bacterium]
MRMLQEPRQRADGSWYWAPVFRPRGTAAPFLPLPVLATSVSWPPFSGRRVPILVNLACNGVSGHVRLREA